MKKIAPQTRDNSAEVITSSSVFWTSSEFVRVDVVRRLDPGACATLPTFCVATLRTRRGRVGEKCARV